MGDLAFRIGGGVQDIPGGVPPRKHKLHRSNIEQEENEMMTEKRLAGIKETFPMHVYKTGGITRIVKSDDELQAALAKGWYDDIRKVPELEPTEEPDRASRMTVKQALAFITEHANDAAKLVEIRADEETHGRRKAVLDALAEAEDNFGAKAPKAKGRKK